MKVQLKRPEETIAQYNEPKRNFLLCFVFYPISYGRLSTNRSQCFQGDGMLHVGELIKARRMEKGLRVKELALLAEVSFSYVYAVEAGHRSLNHLLVIARMAKALDWDVQDLIELLI